MTVSVSQGIFFFYIIRRRKVHFSPCCKHLTSSQSCQAGPESQTYHQRNHFSRARWCGISVPGNGRMSSSSLLLCVCVRVCQWPHVMSQTIKQQESLWLHFGCCHFTKTQNTLKVIHNLQQLIFWFVFTWVTHQLIHFS